LPARSRADQGGSAPAALHLPDGPATRDRDAYLNQLPDRLAWIHAYDVLAPGQRRLG
jgi:hypothetical protein